ncbi:hypothetical protein CsSME_00024346 [Camellia sinensis var. sinensis]
MYGSLNALNTLLKEPVSINRFRPKYMFGPYLNTLLKTFFVDGCEPFAEDLSGYAPTARCTQLIKKLQSEALSQPKLL